MKSIKEFTNIVKTAKFYDTYTNISSTSGIMHRVNGKSTAVGKSKELTDTDKKETKEGLKKLIKDLSTLQDSL